MSGNRPSGSANTGSVLATVSAKSLNVVFGFEVPKSKKKSFAPANLAMPSPTSNLGVANL